MRIRYKKWARPELEASNFYVDNPEELRGKWKEYFKNPKLPLNLELGCGKGQFISFLARNNLDNNYIICFNIFFSIFLFNVSFCQT